VHSIASAHDIPIYQPSSLKTSEAQQDLQQANLDVLIVVAYGLLLPTEVLKTPCLGCINVHASNLPRWRGAAPVERAIMAGDTETGVCIMQMDEGLDTGPVYRRHLLPITETTTGPDLEQQMVDIGVRLLIELLPDLATARPTPQEGTPTYAHKLKAVDSIIDWRVDACQIDRQVRALTGRAPAYASIEDLRVRILEARSVTETGEPGEVLQADKRRLLIGCGKGALDIKKVALNRGKGKPLDIPALFNGYADLFAPGKRFDLPL
jgi:methionyl-tRNA formyltransferase